MNKNDLTNPTDALVYLRHAYTDYINASPSYSSRPFSELMEAIEAIVAAQGGVICSGNDR